MRSQRSSWPMRGFLSWVIDQSEAGVRLPNGVNTIQVAKLQQCSFCLVTWAQNTNGSLSQNTDLCADQVLTVFLSQSENFDSSRIFWAFVSDFTVSGLLVSCHRRFGLTLTADWSLGIVSLFASRLTASARLLMWELLVTFLAKNVCSGPMLQCCRLWVRT